MLALLGTSLVQANDLKIDIKGEAISLKRSDLLKRAASFELPKDGAYGGKASLYQVVPVKDLFAGRIPPEDSALLFEASDGFRVSVSSKKLFYTPGVEALLAVENPKAPWPKIKKKKASAGPYYLIWTGDKVAAEVGQEEWPFMVAKIILQKSLAEEYPRLVPKDVKLSSKVYQGYELFAKHCFACHALDGEGGEKMGPDLARPHSPTQYFQKEYFVKLVRNPQSVRSWPGSQMSAFPVEAISDDEILRIWDYFKHQTR